MRVGILGHVGNENLGDEAIIAAVIQNIRRRWPGAEIRGFTLVPTDTEERHGVPSFPIRRGAGPRHLAESPDGESIAPGQPTDTSLLHRLKELVKTVPVLASVARRTLRVLEAVPEIGREASFLLGCRQHTKELDLLIFAGSHQLNDFVGGPWHYPYTVLKWTLLARAAGAKVVFLSLGAGPIETWLGRSFIRRALKLSSYRSYRDETSKQVVDTLHVFETDKVVPDLAFSLDSPVLSKEAAPSRTPVVGINPLPLYSDYWYMTDERKYETYVGKLASFADWLVDRGCEVRFIPTQLKVDPAVIDDVRRRMTKNASPECGKLIIEPTIHSLDDLLSAISELDFMVATRYHGILLSLALHKPVLAIAYHEKSRDLMNWLGLGDYVIDGATFTVEALTERFPLLEKESRSIASSLRQQTPDFQSSVQAQYDEVFKLMEEMPETT
jgi:polysaccharide pyruvyl transferase WcaK-like protein